MERVGALPRDIKQRNDAEILRSLADLQVFTVQDIADRTGISRLTITRALERFMEKGIVVQSGKGKSTNLGGKKPQEYSLNENRYVISIAPSQGQSECALLSFDGKQIDRIAFGFPEKYKYEDYIAECGKNISELIARNSLDQSNLYGIVLCSGGIIDAEKGIFRISSIPEWNSDLEAAKDLALLLPFDTKVKLENVSKVCSNILRFDNDVQNKATAVMYADYGVSITLLYDGRTLNSFNNVNGELGHMCLEPSDEETCVCGSKGCFEQLISQRRIVKLVDEMTLEDRESLLVSYDGKKDLRCYILEEEKKGNKQAKKLSDYMARYIGLAFRNVVLSVDPDLFYIQGVFTHASDRFIEKIKEVIRENKYLRNIDIDIRKEERSLPEMLKQGSLNIMLSCLLEE